MCVIGWCGVEKTCQREKAARRDAVCQLLRDIKSSSTTPPTPDEYVRENIEPTLTKGLAELCRARPSNPCTWLAEWLQANKPPPPTRTAPEPKPEPLSAEALAAATARYSTTADLRKLLTHDEERGGIPIRLLSARWLLTYFQAEGNETARLEHRQWLEREHPEAFVSGEALERVLAELEQPLWSKGKHMFALPEEYRIPAMFDTAKFEFDKAARTLDHLLGKEDREFAIGNSFCSVDILLAHTFNWAIRFEFDVPERFVALRDRHYARPAAQRAMAVVA